MKNRKGFTLVELVVVVAIIAILAAVAVPRFATATENARVSSFVSNYKSCVAAITLYQAQNGGTIPAAEGDWEVFLETGDLDDLQQHPKGATYVYTGTKELVATITDVNGTPGSLPVGADTSVAGQITITYDPKL